MSMKSMTYVMLDLPNFDALSPQLDLIISASDEFDVPVALYRAKSPDLYSLCWPLSLPRALKSEGGPSMNAEDV